MLNKHRQLGITEEQRFRFASLMSLAANDAGMPNDPEFRSALVAYLEWGTRLALGNSQTGAEVVEHAPVPRWGWGKLPLIDHRRHRRCDLADFASASLPPIGVLGHSRHWGEGSMVVSKASWYLPHCSSQTMIRGGAAVRLPLPSPCSVDRTFKWALLPRQTPQDMGNESRYCNGRSRPALGVAGRHGLLGIASEVDDV
jgi:hypothetical protein